MVTVHTLFALISYEACCTWTCVRVDTIFASSSMLTRVRLTFINICSTQNIGYIELPPHCLCSLDIRIRRDSIKISKTGSYRGNIYLVFLYITVLLWECVRYLTFNSLLAFHCPYSTVPNKRAVGISGGVGGSAIFLTYPRDMGKTFEANIYFYFLVIPWHNTNYSSWTNNLQNFIFQKKCTKLLLLKSQRLTSGGRGALIKHRRVL